MVETAAEGGAGRRPAQRRGRGANRVEDCGPDGFQVGLGALEQSAVEVHLVELGAVEIGPLEPGAVEVRPLEPGAEKVRLLKLGVLEVCLLELGGG